MKRVECDDVDAGDDGVGGGRWWWGCGMQGHKRFDFGTRHLQPRPVLRAEIAADQGRAILPL
ncbi:hypothetical protein V6M83_00040 [Streptococcus anginosus]|uniref:hypothetical protein n=1 Tax=Streptococcus anginosus TaxID=1328 RepID=UPI002FEFD190